MLQVEEEKRELVHQRELSQPCLDELPGLLLHQPADVVPHQPEDELLAEPVERSQTVESYVETGGTATAHPQLGQLTAAVDLLLDPHLYDGPGQARGQLSAANMETF